MNTQRTKFIMDKKWMYCVNEDHCVVLTNVNPNTPFLILSNLWSRMFLKVADYDGKTISRSEKAFSNKAFIKQMADHGIFRFIDIKR